MLVISFVASTLSACSGGPSNGDIKKALAVVIEQANQQTKSLAAMTGMKVSDDMLVKMDGIKNLGCKPLQDSSAFNCEVEVNKKVMQLRFVKASDGWQVMQ